MNKKAFSLINILIIIGFIFLSYLIYDDFFKSKNIKNNDKTQIEDENSAGKPIDEQNIGMAEDENNKNIEETSIIKNEETVINTEKKIIEKVLENNNQPGYYKNITYSYEIKYPAEWPLKIRSEENVSIGTVPPKNGQGAITIEIGANAAGEINQLKKEANKYPGVISVEESSIVVSGVTGTKILLTNNIINKKDVYIILDHLNHGYMIKYSSESEDFFKQAEEALKSFKFLK